MTDPLVDAIQTAVARRLQPDEVEAFVGVPAWINTIRPTDRLALRYVDIGADEAMGTPPPTMDDAIDVAYWGRSRSQTNPRIVGITWNPDGSSQLFFGILYPP